MGTISEAKFRYPVCYRLVVWLRSSEGLSLSLSLDRPTGGSLAADECRTEDTRVVFSPYTV
ncbi:hypothetical protein BHE74_00001910 [Ensete ventricosum]|nr:hypothetical protein BHE74_00001910 [Ensete ventricosum]RZR86819.1 hypothetical protein BHM03_00014081 [Ensete ventricosum]